MGGGLSNLFIESHTSGKTQRTTDDEETFDDEKLVFPCETTTGEDVSHLKIVMANASIQKDFRHHIEENGKLSYLRLFQELQVLRETLFTTNHSENVRTKDIQIPELSSWDIQSFEIRVVLNRCLQPLLKCRETHSNEIKLETAVELFLCCEERILATILEEFRDYIRSPAYQSRLKSSLESTDLKCPVSHKIKSKSVEEPYSITTVRPFHDSLDSELEAYED